jgi:hypothetical protein
MAATDARLDAEPGSFVAPRAPSVNAPAGADRAARIRAAAAGRDTGAVPERPLAPVERGRRGFNNLLGRMTGQAPQPETDPRLAPIPRRPAPLHDEPRSDDREAEPKADPIEVPAFLRRQAN